MRPFLVCSLLLLAVAAGAALWLLASSDEPTDRSREPQPLTVGGIPAADSDDLADLGELAAISVGAGMPLKPSSQGRSEQAAAKDGWATLCVPPLVSRTFSGRVLTSEDQPRAGVDVAWLPGAEVLLAAGLAVLNRDPEEPPSRFLETLWPHLPATRTEDDGTFTLHVEEAESHPGKPSESCGPVLVVRSADALTFLAPASDELGEIVLCSDGPFSVEVVDEEGWAVPGAWAEFDLHFITQPACAGEAKQGNAMSADYASHGIVVPLRSGLGSRFVRDDLPRGAGLLRAGAPGHSTVSRYVFEKNRTKEQSQIVLHPAGSYVGRVLTLDGQPQAGAQVTITSEPGTRYGSRGFRSADDTILPALAGARRGTTRTTLSDGDGRFLFEEVPLRLHDVFVQAHGFQPLRERYVAPDGPSIELRLRAAIQLAVEVRDLHGRPVEQALVEAWRGLGLHPNSLVVDLPVEPSGPFVVRNASEVITTVRASAPLHGEVIERVLNGQALLHLVLPPAGAVEVQVLRKGQPLPGRKIVCTLTDDDSGAFTSLRSATTNANGRARFDHLPPGTLTFEASGSSGRSFGTIGTFDAGGPLDVEVKTGELLTVVMELQSKAVVRGRIVGGSAGIQVSMERDGEHLSQTTTNSEGDFTLIVPGGSCQIRVSGEVMATLDLLPGEERDIELPGPLGARIEGRLTSGGRPVPGWTVSAFSLMGGKAPKVVTDDQGRFALTLPGAGRWTPRLSKIGGASGQGPDLQSMEIEPGGVALLDVELPTSSISVRIVDGEGTAVTDVGISFRRLDKRASPSETYGVRGRPDEQGMARAGWLEPGTWLVEVRDGWAWIGSAGEPFELLEGAAHIHPDLVVQPACRVRGQAWATPGVLVGDQVEVLFIGEEGLRESARLKDDGSFAIFWLSPGRWQVVLAEKHDSGSPVHVPSNAGQILHLVAGQEVTVELIMSPLR